MSEEKLEETRDQHWATPIFLSLMSRDTRLSTNEFNSVLPDAAACMRAPARPTCRYARTGGSSRWQSSSRPASTPMVGARCWVWTSARPRPSRSGWSCLAQTRPRRPARGQAPHLRRPRWAESGTSKILSATRQRCRVALLKNGLVRCHQGDQAAARKFYGPMESWREPGHLRAHQHGAALRRNRENPAPNACQALEEVESA
jgi:hypothetical protein